MMLNITGGLADFQVLQRDSADRADAEVYGVGAPAEGVVEARLLRLGFPLEGWDWRQAGTARGGEWRARLEGLPTGGPYTVELRCGDHTARVHEVLVGDLWILAGQSNMEGVGDLIDVEPGCPQVHCLDMADRWVLAEEPLHWLCDSIDACHTPQEEPAKTATAREVHAGRLKGAGLGLPFAAEMVRRTGVPVGLLACAHGGTSMAQWDPALRDAGGDSLYGSLYRRFRLAGGRVKGLLWYQGESDANRDALGVFADAFRGLVAAFRRDLEAPDLPVYSVQIGRFVLPPEWGPPDPDSWNGVQEAQRRLADEIPGTAVAPAIDLELDDLIHIGTQGLKRLGRRLAEVACGSLFGDARAATPIRLRGVTVEGARLRVAFDGVNGGFSNESRIGGFSLEDAQGAPLAYLYKATVDPERPSDVLLHLVDVPPRGCRLWYGRGLDPYCNLRDSRDMAVPVFGPIDL